MAAIAPIMVERALTLTSPGCLRGNYDLRAARSHGMRTAFVARPIEYGPGQTTDLAPEEEWDIAARDFEALATALGA
jgi:2-haloacid dehalogenase